MLSQVNLEKVKQKSMYKISVSVGSDRQSHKTVSTNHNLFERERRAEAVSNRGPSAYQPNALPLGQTGSPNSDYIWHFFYNRSPTLLTPAQIKPKSFESKRSSSLFFFNLGRTHFMFKCAPFGRYAASTARLISTQAFLRALTASVGSCAEIKSVPSVPYITSFGRVWRKVPERMLGFWCTKRPSQDSIRICVVTGVLRPGHFSHDVYCHGCFTSRPSTGVLRQGHFSHDVCGHKCITSRPPQS